MAGRSYARHTRPACAIITGMDEHTIMVTLHGGPLDGSTTPVDLADSDPWVAIISDGCAYPGGRSVYAPDDTGRWVWERDIPWDAM